MGHKVADPCAALTVLFERLNGSEQQLAVGVTGHGAEALAANVALRHRGVMKFLEFGLVVPEVTVSRGAVLKEVDDALGLRSNLTNVVGNLVVTLRGSREPLFTKKSREGSSADTSGALTEKMAAVDVQLVLCKRIHRRWIE